MGFILIFFSLNFYFLLIELYDCLTGIRCGTSYWWNWRPPIL